MIRVTVNSDHPSILNTTEENTIVTISSAGVEGKIGPPGTSGTSGTAGTSGTSAEFASVTISEEAPDTGTSGKLWFNSNEGTLYVQYDDGNQIIWIPTNDLVGADGTSGVSGTSGLNGTFFGSSGTNGTSGTTGTSGTSGAMGSTGSGGTSGTSGTSAEFASVAISETAPNTGTSGKLWFNSNEGTLYVEYDDGNQIIWIPTNDLVGADGSSGTSGLNGTFFGTSGTSGTSGIDGTSGTSGMNGSSGTSAEDGSSGTSGNDGSSGTSIVNIGSITFENNNIQGNEYDATGYRFIIQTDSNDGVDLDDSLLTITNTPQLQNIVASSIVTFADGVTQTTVASIDINNGTISLGLIDVITLSPAFPIIIESEDYVPGIPASVIIQPDVFNSDVLFEFTPSGSFIVTGSVDVTGSIILNGIEYTSLSEGGGSGTSGTDGTSGTSGTSGDAGSSGTSGTSGTSGSDGSSGTSGLTIDTGSFATTGSNTFIGNQTISGSLIPAVSGAYDLGSVNNPWRHIYVNTGSIFLVNDEQIIKVLNANTIITTTDIASGSVDISPTLPSGIVSSSSQLPSGLISGSSQLTTAFPSKTIGSWSVPAGPSTQSFTVDANNSYTMWVNGNIPNGIITWNATATISNTNVPVLGAQYGWYYEVGNALVLTSMPDQFAGTNGSILTIPGSYGPNTSNVFNFGITNNSGTTQTINYGYIKLS